MKRLIISILFNVLIDSFIVVQISGQITGNQIPVVPLPREIKIGEGVFKIPDRDVAIHITGIEEGTKKIILQQLQDVFSQLYGIDIKEDAHAKIGIRIGCTYGDSGFGQFASKINLIPEDKMGEEGYFLKADKNNIYIISFKEPGAFYGVQTLKQLLNGYSKVRALPVMTIKDWPAISFRCVMDDISRGPVPTNDYIKYQIRRYAEMKINHMSFYIEHIIRTKKYPDFSPGSGGITVEEFRELSEYAADYKINLVGNFQSLGHFEKILSHPQYRHLGATDRMLDPLNPESIKFLRDIYTEMAPAFSSPYFTPNCDEAWDLSRGKMAEATDSLSVAEIYAHHVMRIDSTLLKLGKKTLVWGDIILSHPEILEIIPDHIVIGAWNYSPSESFAEFIDPLKNAGFNFTVSPGVLNSNRLIPDYRMTTTNIRNFINEGYKKGTIGVYCTVWDDGGMHFFSRDWYGIAYNAEHSWNPNFLPLNEFDLRFSKGLYNDDKNIIPTSLHLLNNLTDLEPTFEMNSSVFWKNLIPERGESLSFNPDVWLDVKKWASEAKAILESDSVGVYGEESDFILFTCNQYIFMADARKELINAAGLYNKASELQLTNRQETIQKLFRALEILQTLEIRFSAISKEFERLWDMENRAYWKDRAIMDYQKRKNGFKEQIQLLDNAIKDFQNGIYLPPPTDIRLDIRLQSGQYFQYWLLVGAFPLKSFDESATDFLEPQGGEPKVRPFPGMQFTDKQGTERQWIKYDSPASREINFKKIFEPNVTAVAYAYCTISSNEKQTVKALLGSNDGAMVFLNGEKVHSVHTKRSLIPDEDLIELNLREGSNHLLIKVEQWKGDWGFSFRLQDVEIRNHKQKYYILDK